LGRESGTDLLLTERRGKRLFRRVFTGKNAHVLSGEFGGAVLEERKMRR